MSVCAVQNKYNTTCAMDITERRSVLSSFQQMTFILQQEKMNRPSGLYFEEVQEDGILPEHRGHVVYWLLEVRTVWFKMPK